MRTSRGRRFFTYGRGLGAERTALLWLMLKGYRPIARRFSAAGGEIDLVLRRGGTVVFCEVKARAGLDAALASLDESKRRRIRRAAAAWRSRNAWAAGLTFRADAVYLAPGEWPRHVPDAFGLDPSVRPGS